MIEQRHRCCLIPARLSAKLASETNGRLARIHCDNESCGSHHASTTHHTCTSTLRHVSRFGRRWLLQSVPPMSAARLAFNKLTLRLEDRPIAASTSVLSKAGKPYALRFHRSSSSTAACSMRCSAVQRSVRHCRAYAHRPRPDSWPAYLHVLPTCTSVSISPPLHRIASPTYDAGRAALTRVSAAIVALQLGPPHARQTDLHGHVGAVGGRPGIASHARLCAGGGLTSGEELNAGNPTPIILRDPSCVDPAKEDQENWREFLLSPRTLT